MRFLIAFAAWCLLLTPSINLGRAWQSSAMLGPQITVHSQGTSRTGHYVYKLDGSSWLVDGVGAPYRMDGNEVISSSTQLSPTPNDPLQILTKHWRSLLPLIALTLALWMAAFALWVRQPQLPMLSAQPRK